MRPALPFFLTYCLLVAYATLLPFQFTLERAGRGQRQIQWDPFHLVSGRPTPVSDLLGNILFFVPVGSLAYLAQRRTGSTALLSVARSTGAGALLSVLVEALQCFTPDRNPATNDVLANTLGATLGALGTAGVHLRLSTSRFRGHMTPAVRQEPLVVALAGLLALVTVHALVPFDVSLHLQAVKRSVRTARLDPRQDPWTWVDLEDVLFFALLAGVAYRIVRKLSGRDCGRSAATSLLFVFVFSTSLEILQLTLKSKVTATLDVITACGGGFLGIAIAALVTRDGPSRHAWAWIVTSYVLGLFLISLRPFELHHGVEAIQARLVFLIPRYAEHFGATLSGITAFMDALLLHAPLGFLLTPSTRDVAAPNSFRVHVVVALACGFTAVATGLATGAMRESSTAFTIALPAGLGGLLGAHISSWSAQFRQEHYPAR